MKLQELQASRADHFSAADKLIQAARKTGKDLMGVELEQYQNHIQEIKSLDGLIQRCEEVTALTRATAGKGNVGAGFINLTGEPTAPQHSTTLREAYARATMEQRAQIDGIVAYLSGNVRAAADLTPGGDGGVLIPSFVLTAIERNYAQFAPVASVARLWVTDTGADQVYPVLSDSESAEQLDAAAATGADATVSGDTPPTDLSGPKMGAYKISSKPVFVPRETFTDSPINIIEEIVGALLARIIRFENARFTSGTGTGQAEGFLANCADYAAGAVALDLDVALDLAYACPALYRPNGVYMLSDTTAKYLRKLKTGLTGDNRQLWADADATKGTPATLHGYPVIINNDMASVAADGTFAGVSPLAFGDWKKFVVRRAEQGLPYAYRYSVPAKDGSAVILFRRSDSKLIVPEAITKLVVA